MAYFFGNYPYGVRGYPASRTSRFDNLMDMCLEDFDENPFLPIVYLKKKQQPNQLMRHGYENANKQLTQVDENGFKMNIDVSQFKPEELSVKQVGNRIEVSGKHESKDEHGYSFREFHRRIQVPANMHMEQIKCHLNEKGMLEISAPPLEPPPSVANEKILQIQQVNSAGNDNKTEEKMVQE